MVCQFFKVEGCIQAAHDFGFRAFQLQTGAYGLLATTKSFGDVDTAKIRQKLADLGIKMHLHHHGATACPDVFLFARKEAIFDQFRGYLKAAIDFIHRVGGDMVTFHAPFSDNGESDREGVIDEATRRRAIRIYRELMLEIGDFAGERDVKLGIESTVWSPPNRPWTGPFLCPEDLDEFVKASGMPPCVGILAEVSHLHHMGFNIPALLQLWGEKVYEVHTSDAVLHQWIDKRHYSKTLVQETHRVVGQGTLDFRATVNALKGIGFNGWMSLEIFAMHVKSVRDFVASKEILDKFISARGDDA